MTVTALNTATTSSVGPAGGGLAAKTAGAGALAGFEALIASLFPQAEPGAASLPAAATLGVAAVADPALGDGKGAPSAEPALEESATLDTSAPTAGDAAVALAASLMAAQPATVPTQATTATDPTPTTAFGKDKTKGAPAFPALQVANPHARLAEKAEQAVTAETGTDAAAQEPAEAAPTAAPASPRTTLPPQARAATTPQAPFTPPIPTGADPTPPVAAAAVPTAPAADDAPVVADPSAATDGLMGASELPVETPPIAPRATKTERAKASDDTPKPNSDEPEPLAAADKPLHARAAQGAAKTASATVDDAQAKTGEAKTAVEEAPAADSPDAPILGETRAAAQAAAPASHTVQGPRGTSETVANLAAQVVKKLGEKTTRFDVQLDPHGLGKVDVRIEIGAQGRITAGMTFDNPQAAADVKARATELQRALEQAGFDISGGISFDVAQDRGQQSQQQNQAWQDQGDAGRALQGRAFRAALETAGDAAEAANQGALRLRRGVNAGVDFRI